MSAVNEDNATPQRRKLIEVALPLEVINREAAREKSIRHGHPSTLHLWWARRPLAAARAVLFAQLVDDPSSRPDEFPTEEDQKRERARLFNLIERMVPWEATRDKRILREVREEIQKSCGGNPPPVLDPFAGGGTIPLEAQRLGLEAHASDLNPVPVLINKALIEIPAKWAGQKPVFPEAAAQRGDWSGSSGLAEDVRRYGQWMRDEAFRRIGKLYPKARLEDGSEATVIAWIWARTVKCPNPACGAEMPLASTWWLSKKKNRPRWLEPIVEGKSVRFAVRDGKEGPPDAPKRGRGAKFSCLVCGEVTTDSYIKGEGAAGRIGARLLVTVAEGKRQRVYLAADQTQIAAASVEPPNDVPSEELAFDPRNIWCVNYGLTRFGDLFTSRQLVALTTFSDLVSEARLKVRVDAIAAGASEDESARYGDAVATYLGFAVSRITDYASTITTWASNPQMEILRSTFARQALPMTWDFAEGNVFGPSSGTLEIMVSAIGRTLDMLTGGAVGRVTQADAAVGPYDGLLVSTDPPYYDNIGYADLSDFFYVWLRRSLGSIYPDIMGTMLTPKSAELIASPYRHAGSKEKAEHHFERGFIETFSRIRAGHVADFPLAVFYAFRQSETDEVDGTASTGWETMLNGLMEAGFAVTATWPVRTERAGRSIGIGTNALASSIVLACRPRPETAGTTTRRGFLNALREELPQALRELQQGNVAPVDMAQSAIGPGMAIFSRYAKVTETDGLPMRVRTALALINEVLADVLSEQEGDFDTDTRWCVKWFEQFQWGEASFGQAETLAKAYNTSVSGLEDAGVVKTRAGKAVLATPEDLATVYDPRVERRTSVWEVTMRLSRVLDGKGAGSGIDAAGELLARARTRVDDDAVKELAYLLYSICERNGWSESGRRFNNLVGSWPDLQIAGRAAEKRGATAALSQLSFGSSNDDEEDQLF